MGKVKIRVVGDEQTEREQKEEQKKKRDEKALKKAQVKGVGLGGGQRINVVGPTPEELETQSTAEEKPSELEEETKAEKPEKAKRVKKNAAIKIFSKRHSLNKSAVAVNTSYPIPSGIEILRKFKKGNFDETVELHINVSEKGVSGQVALPHGTGKTLRIKIADDAVIEAVEKGKIDFDILVAEPSMMPKLAKVARVLGPRGLMPNPKNGTISDKPQEAVSKLSAGQVSYKTESAAPLIHMSVGKLSFEDKALEENIKAVLSSIGTAKIDKVTLKSTMSPAVRLQV